MPDNPDYILEIAGQRREGPCGNEPVEAHISTAKARGRRYISVLFECCSVYQRVYRNKDATAYEGGCPRCGRLLRVRIGPGGTDCRFFRAK